MGNCNSPIQILLVSQMIVQQTLLDFRNFPTCTPLFQPALLLDFEIFKQKLGFVVIKFQKFQPARPYSILHSY